MFFSFFLFIHIVVIISTSTFSPSSCLLLCIFLLLLPSCGHIPALGIRQSLAAYCAARTWNLGTCPETIRNNVLHFEITNLLWHTSYNLVIIDVKFLEILHLSQGGRNGSSQIIGVQIKILQLFQIRELSGDLAKEEVPEERQLLQILQQSHLPRDGSEQIVHVQIQPLEFFQIGEHELGQDALEGVSVEVEFLEFGEVSDFSGYDSGDLIEAEIDGCDAGFEAEDSGSGALDAVPIALAVAGKPMVGAAPSWSLGVGIEGNEGITFEEFSLVAARIGLFGIIVDHPAEGLVLR
mmetsp:Transcript_5495/g.8204  ORF Transcript_5495/g.8204 Transcript_5495/m.8204 type:complete len:294 (-) Transcript_5495:301-1182(-)